MLQYIFSIFFQGPIGQHGFLVGWGKLSRCRGFHKDPPRLWEMVAEDHDFRVMDDTKIIGNSGELSSANVRIVDVLKIMGNYGDWSSEITMLGLQRIRG